MKLIVNGDDFGITHACNLAIIDCFQKGVMKSTSMMTNMPYAKEAAALWKENPELSVGIHLTLTAGKPLTEVPSLVKEDGTFNKEILWHPDKADPEEVEQEIEAQIQRFIALTGKLPDHINSHHGIEMIPAAAEIVQRLARKYDRPIRSFMGAPVDKEYDVNFLVAPIPMNEEMWKKDQNAPRDWKEALAGFTPEIIESDGCFELAGHPGYVDKDLVELSSLTTGRIYDAANFQSEEFKQWALDHGVEFISYKDLPRTK